MLRGAAARCEFAFGRKGWGRPFDFRVWVNVCELNCILVLVLLDVYYRPPPKDICDCIVQDPLFGSRKSLNGFS